MFGVDLGSDSPRVFFARPLPLEQQDESMRRWNVILKAWNFPSVFDELSLSSSCRDLHGPSSGSLRTLAEVAEETEIWV